MARSAGEGLLISLYNKNLNSYARENRRAGNLSEALLWNELKRRKLGHDFTKQKPVGNYVLDFYCKELKLAIEVDGDSHDDKIEYDRHRDEYMDSLGIRVIRVWDLDVKKNMEMVIEMIKQTLPGATRHPSLGGELV